jgi:hypothetical protein
LLPIVTVICLQIARDPVHSLVGLSIVAAGIPLAGWVPSDHTSADAGSASHSVRETASSDSTLNDASVAPVANTQI